MNELTEEKPTTSDQAAKVAASDRKEMVVARVPQGHEAKINIRFVPGRDMQLIPVGFACQPRHSGSRPSVNTLPESLVVKLKDANTKVIDWLGRDAANAQLFLARPVEALIKAGVDLDRSEQKTLERTRRAVSEASVIAPGVKIAELTATAHPKGRVGQFKPGSKVKEKPDQDCGCGAKGKKVSLGVSL